MHALIAFQIIILFEVASNQYSGLGLAFAHHTRTLSPASVRVLANGAAVSGHIPREVWAGAVSTDIQAPGILTWAALLIFQRTGAPLF